MASLQGFIDEAITTMRGVAGVDFVPDEPTLMPAKLPMSMVYASTGRGRMAPIGSMTYLHDVRLAFVGPYESLGQTNDFILSKFEAVVEAIYKKLAGSGFANAVAVGDFEYNIGPDDWGGFEVYGLFLTFREVKIQRNL